MSITSLPFYLFVFILLALYYTAGRRFRCQWGILLAAGLLFYAYSGGRNIALILLTAGSCWCGGLRLERLEAGGGLKENESRELRKRRRERIRRRKKLLLLLLLLLNLGILAALKYWKLGRLGILLPLGISFYTFQSLGYLLDIYYGRCRAERSFLRFLLFVSFFPQLLQGPINRYDAMKKSLFSEHSLSWDELKRAVLQIAFGLVKKLAVADLLAQPVADVLDGDVSGRSGALIVFAVLLYSAQQYCDFSGGIDVVMGVSRLFGVAMAPNFRQPYMAVSLADFWQRWHISLGAWMKDYVYYPFALSKTAQRLQKRAAGRLERRMSLVLVGALGNLLVFFLVGLWHGAELHYILWGLYNGLVIALGTLLEPAFAGWRERRGIADGAVWLRGLRIVRTFLIVNIGWYFDRIADAGMAFAALGRTVSHFAAPQFLPQYRELVGEDLSGQKIVLAAAGLLLVLAHSILRERKTDAAALLLRCPVVLRWGFYYGMILLIQIACDISSGAAPFLYAYF